MKLLRYRDKFGRVSVGILRDGVIVKLEDYEDVIEVLVASEGNVARSLANLLESCSSEIKRFTAVEDVSLLPPVQRPSKVIGVGMNYRSFVDQTGESIPEYPILFHKTSSALTGAGQPIVIPPITNQAVPEGELAIIIGKTGTNIPEMDAAKHIAGYTCANDISARNLEFRTSQWTSGKMLETFCPLGPWIVTTDEIGDPSQLNVRTSLNNRVIQDAPTSEMVFDVFQLVSEISSLVRLEVGDVILTGTPSDLGEMTPPVFLDDGDIVRVEIHGIGVLENPVMRM